MVSLQNVLVEPEEILCVFSSDVLESVNGIKTLAILWYRLYLNDSPIAGSQKEPRWI